MLTLNTTIATLSMLAPLAGALPLANESAGVPIVEPASDHLTKATVKDIDWDNMTFEVTTDKEGVSRTVSWSEKTSFTLDGKDSTAKEVLIESGKVDVSIGEDGYATSVSRMSK